ncbi:hypothetical protein PAAG_03880 [Paracoccidioides lutzii Pb01]|uniref:GH16 domain-containing protein n=1 Tax=Paracoccidioides lutzii (strain ATCC MYA-826 / Pb01) TaxID=502779 RepID=C1GZD6_PARBA|nr:hypothetical protein PAAG_03880 [Paracoccidioides lutzii Pb01]EEH41959.1 hypothetical protein PAAG_03880 [Paracoccidioides lutzii Pb01]
MKYIPCFALFAFVCLGAAARGRAPGKTNRDESDYSDNPLDRCECYVVSGPEPGYFQNYRFYDFRSVSPEKTWSANSKSPKPVQNRPSNSNKESRINLEETGFLDDWEIQDWNRDGSLLYPIPIRNYYENVFVLEDTTNKSTDSTYLALRTQRLENHTSTAEIETYIYNIFRCSLRVRLRLHAGRHGRLDDVDDGEDGDGDWDGDRDEDEDDLGVDKDTIPSSGRNRSKMSPVNFRLRPPPKGAVAGIFTYYSRTVESDIEILTSDPSTQVRYANQPDWDPITDLEIPGASTIAQIPIPWTTWATHRLDWFPNMSRWYLNNDLQDEKDYHVPDKPSMLALNLWSDGGEWSGNMTIGSTVLMGIEWIEVAYNTSNTDELSELNRTRFMGHVRSSGRNRPRPILDESIMVKSMHHWEKPKKHGLKRDDFKDDSEESDYGDEKHLHCLVGCRVDDVETVGKPEILWDYSQPHSNTPLEN